MFGMLSVLPELQRELIIANTRDGLAARARGWGVGVSHRHGRRLDRLPDTAPPDDSGRLQPDRPRRHNHARSIPRPGRWRSSHNELPTQRRHPPIGSHLTAATDLLH